MKIHCPYHEDKNPSMHCYSDTAHCFVCNKTVPINEVMNEEDCKKIKPKEKENIEETVAWIKTLPKRFIRGLEFYYDNTGFYVLYPEDDYYFKRTFGNQARYYYPTGHKVPLFKIETNIKKILVVVEGVINALSLDASFSHESICVVSPGSCNSLLDHTDTYLQYDHTIIVVDKDPPGVYNGMILKETLVRAGKTVTLIALDTDFNDLLQQGGPELVKNTFMKELGL